MSTYIAYSGAEDYPFEVRFEADSTHEAKDLAKLYGWTLYGKVVDDFPADTRAMYERWLNDETLH
jgi:hypothetical protein